MLAVGHYSLTARGGNLDPSTRSGVKITTFHNWTTKVATRCSTKLYIYISITPPQRSIKTTVNRAR